MKLRRAMWIAIIGVPVLVLVAIVGLVLSSWRRPELGVVDGHLRPCPDSPNCVCSSTNDDQHGIEPLAADDGAMERLRQTLASLPDVHVVRDDDDYIHAECTTPLLRYVDDIEFQYDAAEGVIHVRSASRVGRSDLGTNRKRVEEIRQRLAGES